MGLNPSREAASRAATHKPPCILWNPKVHFRVHKSPPLLQILNQINQVYTIPLRFISVLSIHLCLDLPSGFFPSGFHTNNLYAFLLSTIRARCHTHLILFGLTNLIILDKEYNLWSSLFSKPTVCFPQCQRPNFAPVQNHRQNYNNLVCSHFYVFRQQTRRQKVLDRMVAGTTRIRSPLNLLLETVLICNCRSEIFVLWYILKRSVCYLYVITLTCILVARQQHTRMLSFLSVYF
jgi:hypothetical protein